MTYPILSIQDFGEHLLKTGDLDPVYIMLNRSGLDSVTLARWCLTYWCTYHVGVASYIAGEAQGADDSWFWQYLGEAAKNELAAPTGGRWPRGKERRHWRGQQAIDSWRALWQRYSEDTGPEAFVEALKKRAPDFKQVASFVESHRGFGPWMAFKVADMLEQVFHVPVNFDNAAVFMFKDPKEAALRYWRRTLKLQDTAKPRDLEGTLNQVVSYLTNYFAGKGYVCPNGQRLVALPEVETILCKWKSHENGHYPLNNDINELHHGLNQWLSVSPLARVLKEAAPV